RSPQLVAQSGNKLVFGSACEIGGILGSLQFFLRPLPFSDVGMHRKSTNEMMFFIEDWACRNLHPHCMSVFGAKPAFKGFRYSLAAGLHSLVVIERILFKQKGSHWLPNHCFDLIAEHFGHSSVYKIS